MKRSQINRAIKAALQKFEKHGWILPPNPHWDVTDFGLNEFLNTGLVLVNLTEQPEYCEKLMFCWKGQWTPEHYHRKKKEDIISRFGKLQMKFPIGFSGKKILKNGNEIPIPESGSITVDSGERVTLGPGIPHSFTALSKYCILGEVSTANDDNNDNVFSDGNIGRFTRIEEDEPARFFLIEDLEDRA